MRTRPSLLEQIAGGAFYEPPDRKAANEEDFIAYAACELPPSWWRVRRGMWYHCGSPTDPNRRHGWKIHLSATPANARAVLEAALPVFLAYGTSFKFTVDRDFLMLSLSKTWQRGGACKFITAYPHDDAQFVALMEALDRATAGFEGPYILSDRRYKDNRILYYRYGSILPVERLRPDGTRVGVLDGPDGSETVDERKAYFSPPAWASDPFPADAEKDEGEPGTLKDGRYEITEALSFSNSGGVFVAQDRQTGAKVLIKEARPLVSWTSEDSDARTILRREYRLLQVLSGSGVTPEPVDYFVDWEHEFLVEEFIAGTSLSSLTAVDPILLRTRPTEAEWEAWYAAFRGLFTRAARAVQRVHERGVLMLDLAPGNILVTADGEVKLIDFETASEIGVDAPTDVCTPGFRAPEKIRQAGGTIASDYYSFAAVMLSQVFHVSIVFELDRSRIADITREVCADSRLPVTLTEAIVAAFAVDPAHRTTLEQLVAALDRSPAIAPHAPRPLADGEAASERIARTRDRLTDYMLATATPDRDDRLFASDFRLFRTNRLSLAYGACGTLAALRRIGRATPARLTDWLRERLPGADGLAPGFGVGQAGIAWALGELGLEREGQTLLRAGARHPLLDTSPSLFNGQAGWGLANLRFFLASQDEEFLAAAIAAADWLAGHARTDELGHPYWTEDGREGAPVHYGLLHGGSGIALFLLYLALASGQPRFLELGRRALDFEIAQKQPTADGGASWRYRSDFSPIVSPYWEYGAAGVGAAVLRYAAVTGAGRYRELYEEIFIETDRKYTFIPGKYNGIAGIGGAHLDAFRLTGDTRYRRAALKAFEGVAVLRVERPKGLALPGSSHLKVSSDWGYGLAGIALFCDRLLSGAASEFLLDEQLLPAHADARRSEELSSAAM
jgi:class III lanthionine synthetase